MVYISTDYVFDGKKETLYLPEDETNPLYVYGKTKLQDISSNAVTENSEGGKSFPKIFTELEEIRWEIKNKIWVIGIIYSWLL